MARLSACFLLCAIAGAFLWGCSESARPEPENGPQYPLRTSPDSLLAQLEWAYENESLGVYMDCLADSFTFYLCEDDWTNDPHLPHFWLRSEEEIIHTNMFAEGGPVDSISLSLETLSVDTVAVPDRRGVGWEYEEDVDLRVYDGHTVYWAGNETVFTIRLDPDDVGPKGEALYEIWEWQDLNRTDRVPTSERSSWGIVKAMFR